MLLHQSLRSQFSSGISITALACALSVQVTSAHAAFIEIFPGDSDGVSVSGPTDQWWIDLPLSITGTPLVPSGDASANLILNSTARSVLD